MPEAFDQVQVSPKRNPDNALQKVAQQFEGLFMHMLLKSMREATPKDGLFDSQQTQFFTRMLINNWHSIYQKEALVLQI